MSQIEREREREKEREREERRDERRETRDKRQETRVERRETRDKRRESRVERRETRDRETWDERAIILLNRPGQNEKNPRTSLEAVQYVFNSPKGELITYYPAEFKIARENRYVWKICIILVSVVCRPAGHKKYKNTNWRCGQDRELAEILAEKAYTWTSEFPYLRRTTEASQKIRNCSKETTMLPMILKFYRIKNRTLSRKCF